MKIPKLYLMLLTVSACTSVYQSGCTPDPGSECRSNYAYVTCEMLGSNSEGVFEAQRCEQVNSVHPGCSIGEVCTDSPDTDSTIDTETDTPDSSSLAVDSDSHQNSGRVCEDACVGEIEPCGWLEESDCKVREDCIWEKVGY